MDHILRSRASIKPCNANIFSILKCAMTPTPVEIWTALWPVDGWCQWCYLAHRLFSTQHVTYTRCMTAIHSLAHVCSRAEALQPAVSVVCVSTASAIDHAGIQMDWHSCPWALLANFNKMWSYLGNVHTSMNAIMRWQKLHHHLLSQAGLLTCLQPSAMPWARASPVCIELIVLYKSTTAAALDVLQGFLTRVHMELEPLSTPCMKQVTSMMQLRVMWQFNSRKDTAQAARCAGFAGQH